MKIITEIAREIDSEGYVDIDDAFIRRVITETVVRSGVQCDDSAQFVVSVALVDDAVSARLNQQYRGKEAPTDILSFPDAFPDATPERHDQLRKISLTGEIDLGELIINCPYIAKCATMDDVPVTQEFAFVIAHGILHLLGYDHGDTMFAIGQSVTDIIHDDIAKDVTYG